MSDVRGFRGRRERQQRYRPGHDYQRVRSSCWFVDRFIEKNPEYAGLRDQD